ncbi:MAG: hypothetical protein HC888_10960 [Candidatus Competibacteraceae bacterium]|nr:hypothetical protein [Candidatus Competibacteraceae bacterium]
MLEIRRQSHEQGIVSLRHGGDEERPYSRPLEDLLDNDGSSEENRDVQPEKRDEWYERIPESVSENHDLLAQSL